MATWLTMPRHGKPSQRLCITRSDLCVNPEIWGYCQTLSIQYRLFLFLFAFWLRVHRVAFILGARVPMSLWVGTARLGNWYTIPMNVGFHAGLGPCSITSDMKEPRTNRLQPATCRDGAFHFPLPARQEIQSYFSLPPEQRDSSEIYVHSKLKKNSGGLHKLLPTPRATIYIYTWILENTLS